MKSKDKNLMAFILVGFLILIVGLLLAISLGAAEIGLNEIWESFFTENQSLENLLIRDVRLPRALAVLLTGGILGVTGAMIQGVTRNPIAEPSILGVSQGATLVIAILYALNISINTFTVMGASLIGALQSGLIVIMFLSKKANNRSTTKILLAGTAMSIFFISLTTIIGLLSNKAQFIGFWVAGGFRNTTWPDFVLVFFMGVIGLVWAIFFSQKINILSLGDDIAISLGENPEKIRLAVLLLMIPMCAAAVAVGKNITFVGLIIPQIARKILGEDYTKIIPASFLLGAILLTYSDIAARMIYSPYEVPIGIFTSLIGVPFFISVARKEKG